MLDVNCLRWAKVENLERLARSLRLALPARDHGEEAYRKALVKLLAAALDLDARMEAARKAREARWTIEDDARRVAAESWRAMTDEQKKDLVTKMVDALEETGGSGKHPRSRVVAQIGRMLDLVGEEWIAERIEAVHTARMFDKLPAGRTLGGHFFRRCREDATVLVKRGSLTRRAFFRAFTDHVPQSKEKAPTSKAREREARRPTRHDRRATSRPVQVTRLRRRA